MTFDDTGLPWVMPSPNMPTLDTALVYPGPVPVRGDQPVRGARHDAAVRDRRRAVPRRPRAGRRRSRETQLPGVRLRPIAFRPTFHKFAGQAVRRRAAARHRRGGVPPLPHRRGADRGGAEAGRRRLPLADRAYEFVADPPAIDLLTGSAEVRTAIEAGRRAARHRGAVRAVRARVRRARRPALLL